MRRRSLTIAATAVALAVAAGGSHLILGEGSASSGQASRHVSARIVERRYDFPLKPSANRRYIVDQRNRPFLVIGDSPQALIGNLSVRDAAAYIADRKRAGFDALWVDLLCTTYTGCRDDGTTSDGIPPFTRLGDLATPNPAYFTRADSIIQLATKAGMAVFLDPIEKGGWLSTLKANGVAKDRAYGMFLGRHYREFPNIVWSFGNDFQTWRDAPDDAVALAVAKGIEAADRSHLSTIELDYPRSASLDDPSWRPLVQLDSAYTHYPTYAEPLAEYNRPDHLPVILAEAGYEFEQNGDWMSKGTPDTMRRQEYWAALSGTAGQFYGDHYTWQFIAGWKQHLDTIGSAQLGYLVHLFAPLPWYRLVPDQTHRLVTAGYGTYTTEGNATSSNYVTTAYTRDGTLAISYLPSGGTLTVAPTRLRRPVQARWYDPTDGRFSAVSRQLPNRRRVTLTAPRRNASGDRDWVLVLTAPAHH